LRRAARSGSPGITSSFITKVNAVANCGFGTLVSRLVTMGRKTAAHGPEGPILAGVLARSSVLSLRIQE
jgi:hypothetical protein